MTDVEFHLYPGWEDTLLEDEDTRDFLQEVGDEVADNARRFTEPDWEGAAGIFAEVRRAEDVGAGGEGVVVDISWEESDYGMGFNETGTEDQAPRPFLLPGLEATSI